MVNKVNGPVGIITSANSSSTIKSRLDKFQSYLSDDSVEMIEEAIRKKKEEEYQKIKNIFKDDSMSMVEKKDAQREYNSIIGFEDMKKILQRLVKTNGKDEDDVLSADQREQVNYALRELEKERYRENHGILKGLFGRKSSKQK